MAFSLPQKLLCVHSPKTSHSPSKSQPLVAGNLRCSVRLRTVPRNSSPEKNSTATSLKNSTSPEKNSSATSGLSLFERLSGGVLKVDGLVTDIMSIALPAALSLAADPIASLVDTAFVGHIGSAELAAVGVSASVFNLIAKFFNVPLLNVTTSFVADEQASASNGNDYSSQIGDVDGRRISRYLSGGLLIGRSIAVLTTTTLATSLAAREGPIRMAGHQICFQVWLAISLLTDALALAGQALLASGYSEGDYEQARQVIYRVLQIGLTMGIGLAIILFLGFGAFSSLFTEDSEVLAVAWSGLLSHRFSESEASSTSPASLSEAIRSEIKFHREFHGLLSDVKQKLAKVLQRLDGAASKLDQPPRSEKQSWKTLTTTGVNSRSDHQGQRTELHRFGPEPPPSRKKGRDRRLRVRSRLWESGTKKNKKTRRVWGTNLEYRVGLRRTTELATAEAGDIVADDEVVLSMTTGEPPCHTEVNHGSSGSETATTLGPECLFESVLRDSRTEMLEPDLALAQPEMTKIEWSLSRVGHAVGGRGKRRLDCSRAQLNRTRTRRPKPLKTTRPHCRRRGLTTRTEFEFGQVAMSNVEAGINLVVRSTNEKETKLSVRGKPPPWPPPKTVSSDVEYKASSKTENEGRSEKASTVEKCGKTVGGTERRSRVLGEDGGGVEARRRWPRRRFSGVEPRAESDGGNSLGAVIGSCDGRRSGGAVAAVRTYKGGELTRGKWWLEKCWLLV